jgi:pimeloyl-ACP methyl ester carboxylesterase
MPPWAAIECYRTYLHADQVESLPALRLPVLQIMGRHDPVSCLEGAAWVQERLAHGGLVELDCGHYPMIEKPLEFNHALLSFLDQQP